MLFAHFLFYASHRIRGHPFRHLIRGNRLLRFSPTDPDEDGLCRRSWPGPVWDVGASLGKYTTLLAEANPNQQVYAFEPNLNSLYYLGYRTAQYSNVTIVPAALTIDGKPMRATYDPNMHNPATGPQGITFSVEEAIARFGVPAFIKLDIEGLEKEMLEKCGKLLSHTTMIVEWHPLCWNNEFPAMPYWRETKPSPRHSLLEPLERKPAT